MAWVYILKGSRHYIGSTNDLHRRLLQHRRGHTSTTKRIGDWNLAWKKEYPSIEEARAVERKIKSWKSAKAITLLINGDMEIL